MIVNYYHLAGGGIAIGSIIKAGNWGRIIRQNGWRHSEALKEMALEAARSASYPHRPSRLDAVFVFIDPIEAKNFRNRIPGFSNHILYRVSLMDEKAPVHIADTRLSGPQGALRPDWADVYWMDFNPSTITIPGIENWSKATNGYIQERELITTSDIRIEEALG